MVQSTDGLVQVVNFGRRLCGGAREGRIVGW